MIDLSHIPTLPSLLTSKHSPYIHRDLSWLQFNERVLEEARVSQNPLLDRVKFLAITATNLDEFFMIRAASMVRSISSKKSKLEWREARRLANLNLHLLESASEFASRQLETLRTLRAELANYGIHLVQQPSRGTRLFNMGATLFKDQILAKLPQIEPFHFSMLSKLENLQTIVLCPNGTALRLPRSLPTVYFQTDPLDPNEIYFFFLDDLIASHLRESPTPWKLGFMRLTRDADFVQEFGDEEIDTIPNVIRHRLGNREQGRPIRVQYAGDLDGAFVEKACHQLRLIPLQAIPSTGILFLHGLWSVVNHTPKEIAASAKLSYPPLAIKFPEAFEDKATLFKKISERDYLLHHPYDSFDAYTRFVETAVDDPLVESIEQTVYRIDALSTSIELLKKAASTKKVSVIIELRARFDEMNNLRLADELEKAGIKVTFGFGALKVHAKITLIGRREGEHLRYYTHLSTGNYNAKTARQYTDLAILTAHPEIGEDARQFFEAIYQGQIPSNFKQLVVAPARLARRLRSHILDEAQAARLGKPARIFAKVNALVDEGIIESLYEASRAGVQIDLVVRGACSLIPGIKGTSDNIRVISIVDRFLEHSRIYYFQNAKRMYLSSADWMPRNFFSRLEIAFPILDPRLYAYLRDLVIPSYLADTVKARELTRQGIWIQRATPPGKTPIRSQVLFREMAHRNYRGTPLEN